MKHIKCISAALLALAILASLFSCSASNEEGQYYGDNDGYSKFYFDLDASEQEIPAEVAAELARKLAAEAGEKIEDMEEYITENHGKIVENPFIKVSENAVSTFSADVDTASYSYFRKLVNSGYTLDNLIDYAGSSIRTEEMINYFSYDYKKPSGGELFGVNFEISNCPWNSEAALLRIGLAADDKVTPRGNNLVFLIDISGSMDSTDKLGLLKIAFTYLTEQLGDNDIVSIVTYAGGEEVVLEGCEGNRGDKIIKTVNSLNASGSTNGEAGLKMAYQIAKKYYIEGGNNRIIMASDGDLNVGINSAAELKSFISEKRDEGVYLSVLGFGTGNYRDEKMETLANNGNGVYYYIDGEAEAEKVFGKDLIGTLYTVADDVKLQLTFDPEYVDSYRLVGYENRLLKAEDFEDDTKDAGEIGAGHTVTVCYELKLTDRAMSAGAWMKLAVRYKNPEETESLLNEYKIGQKDYTSSPSEDFKFITAVTKTAMLLHRSRYLGNAGIEDVLEILNTVDLAADSYKAEFRSLIEVLAARGGGGR